MGDPLSVAASIAGLITLAELIVSRGYEFVKHVKNAKPEISQLLAEITALYGVLQSLGLVAARFQGDHYNTALQLGYLQTCHKLVDTIRIDLKKALPGDSDGRWRAAGKSLRWPFSTAETKCLIEDVARHKATLSLALNTDGLNALLEVLSHQQAAKQGQNEIQASVDHLQEELKSQRLREEVAATHKRRHELLQGWTAIDPETQHNAAVRLRHPGTGRWFLEGEDFRSYIEGHTSALWLYGFAGVGKTVLSSSIIETLKLKLREDTNQGLAYFYCDYKDYATQQAENIMSSLVKHAAVQNQRSCEDLQRFLEKKKQREALGSTPSVSSLTDLLVKMIGHYDCFYVIVDALDESPDGSRREVLDVLKDLSTKAVHARLIYTSRDEIDIQQAFTNFKPVRITANIDDLELYVASEIQTRSSSGRLNIKHSEVKEEIIDTLSHKADGMFRWAACQLDYLCELTNDKARLRALREELPPDLFATYDRILERIMGHCEDVQKMVERTLRWTLGSARQLKIPALIEAIAIEEDENSLDEYGKVDEIEILRWCSCLIRKTPDAESVELAHFTVEEYLKALDPNRTPRLNRFANLAKTADLVLGRTCLTYLNYDEFANTKAEERFWCFKRPFWNYAALQWPRHILETWNDEPTKRLMQRLFRRTISPQFVTWNRAAWLYSQSKVVIGEIEIFEEASEQWKNGELQRVDSVSPLHRAASLVLVDLTQWLISQGCDPNKPSILGFPLECALDSSGSTNPDEMQAELKVITILLGAGANANTRSGVYEDKSPLALAVRTENPDVIKAMLDAGAKIDMSCVAMLEQEMNRRRGSREALPTFLDSVPYADVPLAVKPALMNMALEWNHTRDKALVMLGQSSVQFPENAEHLGYTLQDAALEGQLDVVLRTIPFLGNSIDWRHDEEDRTALHLACMNGHYDIVRVLLANGANPNAQDGESNTPAHLCIKENCNIKVLEILFQHGTRMSIVNAEQENLLHLAAQSVQPNALAFLLTKDPEYKYRYMRTAGGLSLLLCALASPLSSFEMLTLAGSAISISECLAGNKDGETGLHLATKMNDLGRMKYFLDKGNLNETTAGGSTALHYAITDGDLDTVKLLLNWGADVCLATTDGKTPLHLAASHHSESFGAILAVKGIEKAINLKDNYGWPAIHEVIREDYFTSMTLQMMESILEIPTINLNITNGDDRTPLTCLAIDMKLKTVSQDEIRKGIKLLVDKDVDLNKPDGDGATALHYLCDAEVTVPVALSIKLLLDRGIDVLVRNKEGDLAVEILLFNLELRSGNQSWKLSDCESQVFGSLLRHVTDEQFNALNRGLKRPLVLALELKANALIEELAQRTTDVDISFADDVSSTSPLEASCAHSCDFKIFEILASRSKDLSKRNAAGNTLLHLACSHNRIDIFQYLLAQKVGLEVEDSTGSTALNLSMRFGRLEMMEALLDAGADPSHLDGGAINLWHAAAFSPSPEALDRLFQRSKTLQLEVRTSFGYTPLLCAVASGCKEKVEKLLTLKANISATDNQANGVLHLSSTSGATEIMRFLLETDPSLDMNARNSEGQTPLLLAAKNGHHASVAILLDSGADSRIEDESDRTLLHHVASNGRLDILSLLKSKRVNLDLEAKSNRGETPLLRAIEKGHALMVLELLEQGANIDQARTDGWGAPHLAAYYGHAGVITMLIARQYPIDLNAGHPIGGDTPLGIAARKGHLAVVDTLLREGADPRRTNHEGWTVFHIAAINKQRHILESILDYCELFEIAVDINAKDKKGRTALMLVEEAGAGMPLAARKLLIARIAKLLILHGAKKFEPLPDRSQASEETERLEWGGGYCNVDAW